MAEMEAIFRLQVTQKHLLPSSLPLPDTQFTLQSVNRPHVLP